MCILHFEAGVKKRRPPLYIIITFIHPTSVCYQGHPHRSGATVHRQAGRELDHQRGRRARQNRAQLALELACFFQVGDVENRQALDVFPIRGGARQLEHAVHGFLAGAHPLSSSSEPSRTVRRALMLRVSAMPAASLPTRPPMARYFNVESNT